MADMENGKLLFLGAGYALLRAAHRIDRSRTILTSSTEDGAENLRLLGFNAEKLDVRDGRAVDDFFRTHQDIKTVVDSIPPLRDAVDAVSGTRHIAQSLSRLRDPKIIYLSTTGVFGGENGEWVDSRTPPNPRSAQAEHRFKSEEVYRSFAAKASAIRIAAIYGPGRGLGLSMRAGTYRLVDGGGRWSNRIHVDDLGTIISAAIDAKADLPAAICASDDEPALSKDVARFYSEKFSLPYPESITLKEAEARGMHTLTGSQRVSNAETKRLLGVELKYPTYRQGAGSEFS